MVCERKLRTFFVSKLLIHITFYVIGVSVLLERFGHGGDLRTAAELFGKDPDKLLDFSSNMNPLGPPTALKPIIEHYWNLIQAYPDPAQRELRVAIARKHAIAEELVLAGNGAAELIELVVRYLKPEKAAIFVPSFIEYEQAIEKAGAACIPIHTSAEQHFFVSLEQLREVIETKRPQLIMLGYPNNPTGGLLPREQLQYLLECGATIVIDEAFLDFHKDEEQLTIIHQFQLNKEHCERLFVIRSMTKFYSIPGIRLGYIVAAEKHITSLKKLQVPWSVNSLAQMLGTAALEQEQFAKAAKQWLAEEIPWYRNCLEQLGFTVFPTVTNYVLAKIPKRYAITSSMLQQLMGAEGVLIRDASTFKGLDDTFIRLAIKDRASNVQMFKALERVLIEY